MGSSSEQYITAHREVSPRTRDIHIFGHGIHSCNQTSYNRQETITTVVAYKCVYKVENTRGL